MYGPGKPSRALKHKQVSSIMTGPWRRRTASKHFSLVISSGSPWYSGKSTALPITYGTSQHRNYANTNHLRHIIT